MPELKLDELFPTKSSIIIFVLYILLFVSQGILVTASQESNNQYNYNVVTVVLFTEVLKLFASAGLYLKDHSSKSLVLEVLKNKNVFGLYFVPAVLYCLYNNLAFTNLSTFDPTTYYLLLQLRVVVTGILFQLVFSKSLSKKQWISLILLTCGCMVKQMNFSTAPDPDVGKSMSADMGMSSFLLFVQIICSCLAGVYNEHLLKKEGANVDIYVQNIFMYLDSILCNLILLIYQGSLSETISLETISNILHMKVVIVMINNASIGIITSFFLKTLNSILKTFASSLELVLTAILSFIFFGIPVYINTFVSIGIVLLAVYLYSQNPVVNIAPKPVAEKEELLAEV